MKNSLAITKTDASISEMENTLRAFGKTLIKLNEGGNNLVLGGSYALLLNGINIYRKPEDVDIIIYAPTSKQEELLDSLQDFNTLDNDTDYPTSVIKLKTTYLNLKYTLDILIVDDLPMPKHLLTYEILHEKARHN